jgi:hypothetical protein
MNPFVERAYELAASASEKASTVAAGTLALSITFRTSITPEHPRMSIFLIVAWVALTICVVAYVLGLLSEAALWLTVDERTTNLSTKQKLLIIVPAVFTWGGLGTGMTFFALFAIINVRT